MCKFFLKTAWVKLLFVALVVSLVQSPAFGQIDSGGDELPGGPGPGAPALPLDWVEITGYSSVQDDNNLIPDPLPKSKRIQDLVGVLIGLVHHYEATLPNDLENSINFDAAPWANITREMITKVPTAQAELFVNPGLPFHWIITEQAAYLKDSGKGGNVSGEAQSIANCNTRTPNRVTVLKHDLAISDSNGFVPINTKWTFQISINRVLVREGEVRLEFRGGARVAVAYIKDQPNPIVSENASISLPDLFLPASADLKFECTCGVNRQGPAPPRNAYEKTATFVNNLEIR